MRFQVPQFIDVEDKIFGPLTFKQFAYLVGGAGLSYVLWVVLPNFIAVLLILPIAGITLSLAFYKVNNKPFIFTLQSALKYFTRSKLYVWKKEEGKRPKKAPQAQKENSAEELFIPKLSDSKLKEISWSLGIKDSVYSEEDNN